MYLRFQPYLNPGTGECAGIETLVCWWHPTLGRIQGHEFLPLDQRAGQLAGLGEYLLGVSCQALAGWSEVPGGERLRVAVNVSARQVLSPGFVPMVAAALAGAHLAPERLILELVENAQLDQPAAREHLRQVAEIGVRLALDDYGADDGLATGPRSFPVTQIKVDRSFTTQPVETLELVLSVAGLLAPETVVQGIDTADQVATVPDGALTQGDHVAIPMSAYGVREWLGLRVA